MLFTCKVSVEDGIFYDESVAERVLEVPGAVSLEALCTAILESYDFDFDQRYSFMIGSRIYEGEPGRKGDCGIKLYRLDLRKGDVFRFQYDYEDEWLFTIEVMDVSDRKGDGIRILESKGSIEQYPDLSEWDESWMEEDEDWEDEYEDWEEDESTGMEVFLQGPVPSDALLEAAFRLKKTRIMKTGFGDIIFAMRFEDGETGLVQVDQEKNPALTLIRGQEAMERFAGFLQMQRGDGPFHLKREKAFLQDFMSLAFVGRDQMEEFMLEPVRDFASRQGIRLSGKNAFPRFHRVRPSRLPLPFLEEEEQENLIRAAEAAEALAGLYKKSPQKGLGEKEPILQVPLLVREGGEWKPGGELTLPEVPEPVYEKPVMNEIQMRKLKKKKANGVLEAGIYLAESAEADEEGLYLPYVLAARRKETGECVLLEPVPDLEDHLDMLAGDLLQELFDLSWKPARILVEDERAYAFLSPLAAGIGASLEMTGDLEDLHEMIRELDEDFDDEDFAYDEVIKVMEMIADAPAKILKTMPPELREVAREMVEAGVLPDDLERRVRKKLGF